MGKGWACLKKLTPAPTPTPTPPTPAPNPIVPAPPAPAPVLTPVVPGAPPVVTPGDVPRIQPMIAPTGTTDQDLINTAFNEGITIGNGRLGVSDTTGTWIYWFIDPAQCTVSQAPHQAHCYLYQWHDSYESATCGSCFLKYETQWVYKESIFATDLGNGYTDAHGTQTDLFTPIGAACTDRPDLTGPQPCGSPPR
jgi:hypothetical protein